MKLVVGVGRVNALLGTDLGAEGITELIEPLGFGAEPEGGSLAVTVPTNRPDVREAPFGVDDVIEEVARIYGYARLPRRQPSWPEPGRLTRHQRERRRVRDVLCGLGAFEAWTPSFVDDADHRRMGLEGPTVAVTNPLVSDEAFLRRSLLPGLLRALVYNVDRRQGAIRLYEVGTVFSHPDAGGSRTVERSGAGGATTAWLPGERELVCAVFAEDGDDARTAVAAWYVLREALGVTEVEIDAPGTDVDAAPEVGANSSRGGSPVSTRPAPAAWSRAWAWRSAQSARSTRASRPTSGSTAGSLGSSSTSASSSTPPSPHGPPTRRGRSAAFHPRTSTWRWSSTTRYPRRGWGGSCRKPEASSSSR